MKNKLLLIIIVFIRVNIIYSQQTTWTELNSGVTTTLTSVWCYQPPSCVWVCGYSGTVLKSTNLGINWVNLTGNGIPTNVQLINICSPANYSNIAFTAGYLGSDTWVWRTTNGGINWTQIFYQAGGFINSVWMINNNIGFMMGDPVGQRWSLWKTTNGGTLWDSTGLFLPQSGSETGYNNSMFIYYPKIWFGTNNSRIYYSTNFGNNWTIQSVPDIYSYAIGGNPLVHFELFFGGGYLFKTTNDGMNWIQINSIGGGDFAGIGTTPLPVDYPQYQLVWYIRNSNQIYFGLSSGTNWVIEYTNPTASMKYHHLSFAQAGYRMFAVGTLGKISVRDLPYQVKKISTEIPPDFKLFQNYPNPFNQSTVIEFQCPVRSKIILEIYDISGKLISVLTNNEYDAGKYQIKFSGNYLSSGIYFIKLIAENFTQTRWMVLIK